MLSWGSWGSLRRTFLSEAAAAACLVSRGGVGGRAGRDSRRLLEAGAEDAMAASSGSVGDLDSSDLAEERISAACMYRTGGTTSGRLERRKGRWSGQWSWVDKRWTQLGVTKKEQLDGCIRRTLDLECGVLELRGSKSDQAPKVRYRSHDPRHGGLFPAKNA